MSESITKLAIFVLSAAILGACALIVNPGNMAYAQLNITFGNNTKQGNLTAVVDVDTLTKNIKERHPILSQSPADEDKDIFLKIKGMDPKEAAKTTLALNIIRLLQQYKELD